MAWAAGTHDSGAFPRPTDGQPVTVVPAPSLAEIPSAAEVVIDTLDVVRQVPATLYGTNVEWIWGGQGLWSECDRELDPEAVKLCRQLGPTLIRFPGGVFSDCYDWRNGLGPQSARPTTPIHPGGPVSRHSFGIQEFSELARAADAKPLLTVNAGNGTAEMAADWVRYMNRKVGPRVQYWEVGNELYMAGDLSGGALAAETYAAKFAGFADAMRSVDPRIHVGAIGGLNYDRYNFITDDHWTETVLGLVADRIDFLAVHNAYAPVLMTGADMAADPRAVYAALLAAPVGIERNLADVSALLAAYERPDRPISIAVTEWGPLFQVTPDCPWVDHVKTMGSALFVASTLNAFLRSPRVEVATFFKYNDPLFIGWIGRTADGHWRTTAPYMVFSLYRHNLGRTMVRTTVAGPTYDSQAIGVVGAFSGVPCLDAVATLDRGTLAVMVVNKSEGAIDGRLALKGVTGYGGVQVKTVRAMSLDANTGTVLPNIPGITWAPQVDMGRFNLGDPGEISVSSGKLPAAKSHGADQSLSYTFPPLSVTCLTFKDVKRGSR